MKFIQLYVYMIYIYVYLFNTKLFSCQEKIAITYIREHI
jgi:hypothetical protein